LPYGVLKGFMKDSIFLSSKLPRLMIKGFLSIILAAVTGLVLSYSVMMLNFSYSPTAVAIASLLLLSMYITFRNALGAIFAPAYAKARKE